MEREKFSTQIGYLMATAGCAIGLGNIYRFPYIVGQNGGAFFLIVYIIAVLFLGLPLVIIETSIGRGSGMSSVRALETLSRGNKKRWWIFQILPFAACYIYQIFYTTITSQVVYSAICMVTGKYDNLDASGVEALIMDYNAKSYLIVVIVIAIILLALLICVFGLEKSVEKMSVYMLTLLIIIMIALTIRSFTLAGAGQGLSFYLNPNFQSMKNHGFLRIASSAVGQVFFSLGIASGAICICGSYMNREKRILGQSTKVILMDMGIAIMAGFIIFPACFTYGVVPENGPNLIFVTMPLVFNKMLGGRLWGTLFFIAVIMAALTTVVTAFESIVGSTMDFFRWTRKKAVFINIIPLILCSLPAALSSNVLKNVTILGRDIIGAEDFIISSVLMPIAAIGYALFVTSEKGWGWTSFVEETNKGTGIKFPHILRGYVRYVLPIIIIFMVVSSFI